MKKILLICGSGIITSTIVKKKLEEVLHKKGLEGKYSLSQARAEEVAEISKDFDLCVSTTVLGAHVDCPIVLATNFLMGGNTEEIVQKICDLID